MPTYSNLDVLFGRSSNLRNHAGNLKFRQLISDRREEYERSSNKSEKTDIAETIVTRIYQDGGRFLKQADHNKTLWEEVDEKRARLKVLYTFRTMRKIIRRQSLLDETTIADAGDVIDAAIDTVVRESAAVAATGGVHDDDDDANEMPSLSVADAGDVIDAASASTSTRKRKVVATVTTIEENHKLRDFVTNTHDCYKVPPLTFYQWLLDHDIESLDHLCEACYEEEFVDTEMRTQGGLRLFKKKKFFKALMEAAPKAAAAATATAPAPAPAPAPTDPLGTTTNTASGSASANHDGTIDAAQIRVPGFLTASGNPVNVNQSAAWEHQCQLRRYRLLAEHQAASIEDAHADDLDGNRRLTELDIRMNNEIGLELGYSGINIVLGDIEPLEYEIDEFHHPIREDYYRTAGQVLLDRFARFLPSFHVPCMVFRREEPLRLLKPREKPTGGWNGGQIGSDAAQPQQQQHTGDRADGTQQQPYVDDFDAGSASAADPGAAPGGGVAASTNIPPAGGVASVADPGAAPGGDVAVAASNTDNNSSTERATADTVAAASASASSLSTHNITTTNTNNTSAASTSSSSTRITATPLPPPTGFRYEKSSKQSSTDPSDCAQLFNWSKMVRNEWNTYLLLKEVISKKDVDSKSIAAIKALNSPHLYYHICNNLPVTVIIVLSYAPFGLYEGSPLHKWMELFFQGVSFLVIDLCPIIAPGGVGILGRKNNTETILGQTIHNKIMTMLERILRVIRDGNRAIIVGFGDAARHSGNMADIIGNYHARHPCTIYAGVGNIDTDYDALVLGAKLQMKLFGTDDQHEIEKWLHSIKFEIMSTNRAFTQDTVNVTKKIEQSRAWNRIGMHIDYNFKPLKITTNFWLVDEIKELLKFCIARMTTSSGTGRQYVDWSGWEDSFGSSFTRLNAQKKIVAMLTSCYGRNKPRTREQFESLLDNLTVVR